MRKLFYFSLFSIILCLTTACNNEKNTFHLKGDIVGLKDSVVHLYGIFFTPDSFIQVPVENGKFSHDMLLDTITPLYLHINSLNREYPIFADKATTIHIEGDTANLYISGNEAQEIYNQFADSVKHLTDFEILQQAADSFIIQNPQSVVSIYLIDRYFVQVDNPDKKDTENAIKHLSGIMHDHPYIVRLQEKLNEQSGVRRDRYINLTNLPDTTGIAPKSDSFKDKYTLLTLWASWHAPSVEWQDSLKSIIKSFQKRPVQFASLSLDTDREQWLAAIRKDTLQGIHLCDFKGWNSPTVALTDAVDLPCIIILNDKNRILKSGLWDYEFKQYLNRQLDDWERILKDKKKKK